MLGERLKAEISFWVAPHRVNVVGVALRVVVLDKKPLCLESVVMGVSQFSASRPRKMHGLCISGGFNPWGNPLRIGIDECREQFALARPKV